jgi:hypothetical protein
LSFELEEWEDLEELILEAEKLIEGIELDKQLYAC